MKLHASEYHSFDPSNNKTTIRISKAETSERFLPLDPSHLCRNLLCRKKKLMQKRKHMKQRKVIHTKTYIYDRETYAY